MSNSTNNLPASTESEIDENGIKTITSWKWGPNHERVKVIRRVKMERVEKPILKRVLDRAHLVPFGLPSSGNDGVTLQSVDDIYMEKNKPGEEKDATTHGTGRLVCKYCKGAHLSLRCPYRELMAHQQEKEAPQESTSAPARSDRYVPPGRRNVQRSGEYKEEDEGVSIRISNVAEDVDERTLSRLFSMCGSLTRMRIISDYVTHKSRGFAFAGYATKEEAERAIKMYDGYALNHLILSVSIAEKRKSTGPRYSTGYGKALPQNMRR